MTTCTAYCKFCGKEYKVKSEWIPGEVLDLVIDFKHFFHAIRHHYKECGFKKFVKEFFRIWKGVFKSIGIGLLIIVKLIFYPLYLLLSLLYE